MVVLHISIVLCGWVLNFCGSVDEASVWGLRDSNCLGLNRFEEEHKVEWMWRLRGLPLFVLLRFIASEWRVE